MPRLLVATLYAGENDYSDMIQSLNVQTFRCFDHYAFHWFPNFQAHWLLYKTMMHYSNYFDFFVKIDADMVLRRTNALQCIIDLFDANESLDHAVFTVRDCLSETDIWGLHAFRNTVTWRLDPEERRFVDPDPINIRQKMMFRTDPAPIANHMPNPSRAQCFDFGSHRAVKILQSGAANVNSAQRQYQWHLIDNIYRAYRRRPGPLREAALCGAASAIIQQRGEQMEKQQDNNTAGLASPNGVFMQMIVSFFVRLFWDPYSPARVLITTRYFAIPRIRRKLARLIDCCKKRLAPHARY